MRRSARRARRAGHRQREAADAEIVTVGAEIFWHVDAQRYVDLEIRHQIVEWLHAGQQWQLREAERQQDRVRQFQPARSEEHTSELQSLMRISYAVFCLKKKKNTR